MDEIITQLSNGDDSTLLKVLELWEARYANEYNSLKDEYNKQLDDGIFDCLPSSYKERLIDVVKLRASLSTEIEALEAIRLEIEDSASVSEVHFRLEQLSRENKKLENDLKKVYTKFEELDIQKKVLEAEMEGLKTKSSEEIAIAQSRVKTAEQALLATTKAFNKRVETTKLPSLSPLTTHSTSVSEIDVHQFDAPKIHQPEPTFAKLKIGFSGINLLEDTDDQFIMSDMLDSDEDLDDFCGSLIAKATANKKMRSSNLSSKLLLKQISTTPTPSSSIQDVTVTPISSLTEKPLESSTPRKKDSGTFREAPDSPTKPKTLAIDLFVSSSPLCSDVEDSSIADKPSKDIKDSFVPRHEFDKVLNELKALKNSKIEESEAYNVTCNLEKLRSEVVCQESATQIDPAESIMPQLLPDWSICSSNVIPEFGKPILQNQIFDSDHELCGVTLRKRSRGREAIKNVIHFLKHPSSKNRRNKSRDSLRSVESLPLPQTRCQLVDMGIQTDEAIKELNLRDWQADNLLNELMLTARSINNQLASFGNSNDSDWSVKKFEINSDDLDEIVIYKKQIYVNCALEKLKNGLDYIGSTLKIALKEFQRCNRDSGLLSVSLTDSDTNMNENWRAVEKLLAQRLPDEVRQGLSNLSEILEQERSQMQDEFDHRMKELHASLSTNMIDVEKRNSDMECLVSELREKLAKSDQNSSVLDLKYSNLERYIKDQDHELEIEREEVARLENLVNKLKSDNEQLKLSKPVNHQQPVSSVVNLSSIRNPALVHTTTQTLELNSAIDRRDAETIYDLGQETRPVDNAQVIIELREELAQVQITLNKVSADEKLLRTQLKEQRKYSQVLQDTLDETNAMFEKDHQFNAVAPISSQVNYFSVKNPVDGKLKGLDTELLEAENKIPTTLDEEEEEEKAITDRAGFISPDSLSSDGAFSAVTSSPDGIGMGMQPSDAQSMNQPNLLDRTGLEDSEDDPFNDKIFPQALNLGSYTMVDFDRLANDYSESRLELARAKAEIEVLRKEINDLNNYNNELQRDFDEIQQQLETQDELSNQLASDLSKMEFACKMALKQRDENRNIIEERDEDLYMLREDKELQDDEIKRLRLEMEELRGKISKSISSADSGMVDVSVQFLENDFQDVCRLQMTQVQEVIFHPESMPIEHVQINQRDDTDLTENLNSSSHSSISPASSSSSIHSSMVNVCRYKETGLQTDFLEDEELRQLQLERQNLSDELEAVHDQLNCLRSQIAMFSLDLETRTRELHDSDNKAKLLEKRTLELHQELLAANAQREAATQCSNQYAVQTNLIKENLEKSTCENQKLLANVRDLELELSLAQKMKLDSMKKLEETSKELNRLKIEFNTNKVELRTVKETASRLATEIPSTGLSQNHLSRLNDISMSLEFARKTTIESESMSRQVHEMQRRVSLYLAEAQLQLVSTVTKNSLHRTPTDGEKIINIVESPIRAWEGGSSFQSRRTVDGSSECLDLVEELSSNEDDENSPNIAGDTFAKVKKLRSQYSHLLNKQPQLKPNFLVQSPQNPPPSTAWTQSIRQERRLIEQSLQRIDTMLAGPPNDLHGSFGSIANCSSSGKAMSDFSCQTQGLSTLNVPMDKYKHMFAKFQRAESHRRALSYQKRYLLLCLGNFDFPEEVIVANLSLNSLNPIGAHMHSSNETITLSKIRSQSFKNLEPFSKFRVFVRVVMAIYRMHQIVQKWQNLGLKSGSYLANGHYKNSTIPAAHSSLSRTPLEPFDIVPNSFFDESSAATTIKSNPQNIRRIGRVSDSSTCTKTTPEVVPGAPRLQTKATPKRNTIPGNFNNIKKLSNSTPLRPNAVSLRKPKK